MALQKLHWKPAEFYSATLAELGEAMEGHEYDEQMVNYRLRKLCFYTIAPHRSKDSKIDSERDLWPHPFDEEIEKERIKNLPKATITRE